MSKAPLRNELKGQPTHELEDIRLSTTSALDLSCENLADLCARKLVYTGHSELLTTHPFRQADEQRE